MNLDVGYRPTWRTIVGDGGGVGLLVGSVAG